MPRLSRTTAYGALLCALAAPVPASAASGGAAASPAPRVKAIECRTLCSGPGVARPGSTVVVTGARLADVRTVTFLGVAGAADDQTTAPTTVAPKKLSVVVPDAAAGGPVVLAKGDGALSRPSPALTVERVAMHRIASPNGGPAIDVAVTGRRAFVDGARLPTITFAVHDSAPVHVVVAVTRISDGAPVTSFDQGDVPPGQLRTVSWDGTVGGVEQPDGRYRLVIAARNASGATATTAQASQPPPDSFMLLGHQFPVRGKHDFGESIAAFGGARHHEGQDVFAACGTPLVAARGGVVKMKRWQSRAGNYLIIDGEASDVDHAYMHLREPALVDKGDRVRTGQVIGYVGRTGDASACHLHFEEWSGPGWYTGGSPFDPLPDLEAWDKQS